MLENFSECQFQGMVHRTRLERNDSMSQMEGWKKNTNNTYLYTYIQSGYLYYMWYIIDSYANQHCCVTKRKLHMYVLLHEYTYHEGKESEKVCSRFLSHLWKMLHVVSSSIFKLALPQSFPFSPLPPRGSPNVRKRRVVPIPYALSDFP